MDYNHLCAKGPKAGLSAPMPLSVWFVLRARRESAQARPALPCTLGEGFLYKNLTPEHKTNKTTSPEAGLQETT